LKIIKSSLKILCFKINCLEIFLFLTLYAFLVESINTKNIKNSSLTAAKIWDNQYELIAKTER